jgi:hypothetical protein
MEYNIAQDPKGVPGQPNPPELVAEAKLDIITQIVKAKTDILWIIDNSCSMDEEQQALINNFDAFINYFIDSGLDWHVGVVSMDMSRNDHKGRLRSAGGFTYLDESSPSPVALFHEMAAMGTAGSGTEKGLEASHSALEEHRDGFNQGFYRNDAILNIIVISDEEDQSNAIGVSEYISWLTNLKGDVDDVTFSSIVCLKTGILNGQNCGTGIFAAMSVGSRYISVTQAVDGVLWDIRETNWADVLDELGELATGLKQEFFLSDVPIPETIEVWVDIVDEEGDKTTYTFKQGTDYIYSRIRNSITFITYVPPQFSKINIEYIPLGTYSYGDIGPDTGH